MSKAHKPKHDHPWRNLRIVSKAESERIREASTNAMINSYKVGGGRP